MEGRKYKVTIDLKEKNITKSSTMYTASDIDMVEAGLDESAQQQSSPNQAQDNSNVVVCTITKVVHFKKLSIDIKYYFSGSNQKDPLTTDQHKRKNF